MENTLLLSVLIRLAQIIFVIYERFFVLLAVTGHDYKFISIDVGGYGKNSDSGIFFKSRIDK